MDQKKEQDLSAINAGDRFRLPSGNTVEVLPGRVGMGEYRCKYVEISPRPFLGEGVEFGDSCVLSVDFLLDLGERV